MRPYLPLLLIAVFAWLGLKVHDSVAELAGLGRGVRDAGAAVDSTARGAADAVSEVPLVGAAAGDALRRVGAEQARRLDAAGREGEEQALETARLLGWLAFLAPTVGLLAAVGPALVRQVRARRAARRLLGDGPLDSEREAALARRAAYGLPYTVLERHTRDPIGDLLAGRHEPLLAALRDDADVRFGT
jgi:hypothetical protein